MDRGSLYKCAAFAGIGAARIEGRSLARCFCVLARFLSLPRRLDGRIFFAGHTRQLCCRRGSGASPSALPPRLPVKHLPVGGSASQLSVSRLGELSQLRLLSKRYQITVNESRALSVVAPRYYR
jgi:hypothetical protein